MKLSEALANAKSVLDAYAAYNSGAGLVEAVENLIEAVEAHLEAERRHADTLLGLADLQRWGGE